MRKMSLKFCANLTFMYQECPDLLGRYSLAKESGFKAVEVGFPYDFKIDEVVAAKTKAGVEQILINTYPGDLKNGDRGLAAVQGREQDFRESVEKAIKYAKALKCERIHIMSGCADSTDRQNIELYMENISIATKLMEQNNIVGLIEPINNYSVPNYFLNNYKTGIEVVKMINSPFLKLQLDIFHLQHICGNLTNNIQHLLPLVGHIQIAQVPSRNEPNTPGEINYKYIFDVLQQQGYKGWIGLEYNPKGNTKDGLNWLTEYGLNL